MPRGKRLYNVQKYLEKMNDNSKSINKENIIYARVSSLQQINDLNRQIKKLKDLYPDYKLISDIGSGINLNKRGLKKIIDLAISGKINNLVVLYKDRLARFGYNLI